MSVNSEICKARTLFLSRGILNRDVISDVIVYSWVRSKLHNISAELLNISGEKKSLDILSLDKTSSRTIKFLRTIKATDSVIYYCHDDGYVIYSNNNDIHDLPNFTNISEEIIGTNAGGISIITGENVTVDGCEHYNKSLINYISSSIVIKSDLDKNNRIITLVSPRRFRSSHDRTLRTIEGHFYKNDDLSEQNINEISYDNLGRHQESISNLRLSNQENINEMNQSRFDHTSNNSDHPHNESDPNPNRLMISLDDRDDTSNKTDPVPTQLRNNMDTVLDESKEHARSLNSQTTIEVNKDVNTLKKGVENHLTEDKDKTYESNVCNECKVFTLSIIEENTIREALDYYKWNLKKASEALGIGRSTLYRKLKDYDINKQ